MGKASICDASSEPVTTPGLDYHATIDRLKAEFVEFANNAVHKLAYLIETGLVADSDA